MSTSEPLTHFGRIYPPDEAWLAKQLPEPILDPDLPIIDPHHHLWDRPNHRYLLDEFLADVRTGHHIVARCSRNVTPCTVPTDRKSYDRWVKPSSSLASRR